MALLREKITEIVVSHYCKICEDVERKLHPDLDDDKIEKLAKKRLNKIKFEWTGIKGWKVYI